MPKNVKESSREKSIRSQVQEINDAIVEGASQKTIFRRIVQAVRHLGFDRVRLDLLTQDGTSIQPVDQQGFGTESSLRPIPVSADAGFTKLRSDPRPQIVSSGGTIQRGCASIPIILRREVVGRLFVESDRIQKTIAGNGLEGAFLFAQQVALALAIESNEARREAESLETLRRTTLAITSIRERDELLKTLVEQSVKLLNAKSGGIYEYRPERQDLEIIADYNSLQNIGNVLKKGEGLAGRLIETDESHLIVNDYNKWEGQAAIYKGQYKFGAVVGVPLRWKNRKIGVLYVDDEVGRSFSETDVHLLRLFADQAVICLINSALLAEDGRKLAGLEHLAHATREMMGGLEALPLSERLAVIARNAAEILNAESSSVFLVRDGKLVLEASFGHLEGFDLRKASPLQIQAEPVGGLAGYIAYCGKPFKAYGESLRQHPAVADHPASDSISSGVCYSLLALPLNARSKQKEELLGLLRVDNKKDNSGTLASLGFSQEDEWILTIFAEAAIVSIESAELVNQLKEQKAFLQRLISSSPEGIIAVDRHGRITEFNRRAEEILGYARSEVIGTPVAPLYFDPQEPRRIGARLHEAPDHHALGYETFVRSRADDKIPIRHSSTWLLDATGGRVGSVAYFEDLRSQKALKRREMLADLSKELLLTNLVQETMDRAMEFACRIFETEFASIVLPDREGRLILSASMGWEMTGTSILGRDDASQTDYTIREQTPVAIADFSAVTEFKVSKIIVDQGIHSGLSVPMFRGGEVVGAMLIYTIDPRSFTEDDKILLSLIANQTAIALEGARQYEASQRKSAYIETLYEVSRAITAERALEQGQFLDQIVQPAISKIISIEGPRPTLSTILLYDEDDDTLTLASVFPTERTEEMKRLLGEQRSPHALLANGNKIGIAGRVVLNREMKILDDVRNDPDYIGFPPETRSELAVPLIDRDRVIGVLNVESDHACAFNQEDREALVALSELVTVALLNIHHQEQLRTQTTLAWMGLSNVVGRHEQAGKVGLMRSRLYLIRSMLGKGVPPEAIERELALIEKSLQEISLDKPEGQVGEKLSIASVNGDIIFLYRRRFLEAQSNRGVSLETDCGVGSEACVRVNVQWLFRVIDILISNAIQAKASSITLGSRPARSRAWIEIYVSDDGIGISAEVRHKLFREPVRKGAKGFGFGLMIAQSVVKTYGGSIYHEDRHPLGTTMVMLLPLSEVLSSRRKLSTDR